MQCSFFLLFASFLLLGDQVGVGEGTDFGKPPSMKAQAETQAKEKHGRELVAKLRSQLEAVKDPVKRNKKLVSISDMLKAKEGELNKATGMSGEDIKAIIAMLYSDFATAIEDENWAPPEKEAEQDHYKILGLQRDASTSAIRRAYRTLAVIHHPDKAEGDAKEAATKLFAQIALAYEILSNPMVKTRYDQTGSSESEYNQKMDPNDRYYMPPEVERQAVRPKEIHSFKQLQKATLDETGKVHTSILVALVDQQQQQCLEYAAFGVKFPYPFAGWQETYFGADNNGLNIWWEDFMQTYTVQVYDKEAVELFEPRRCPTFIFVKKGTQLEDFKKIPYSRMDQAPNNDVKLGFQGWVWEQMAVFVNVRNDHHRPVQLYELQKPDEPILVKVLKPGQKFRHKSAVTYELFAREVGIEGFTLSKNAVLDHLTITDWGFQTFVVRTRCADINGDCPSMIERESCGELAMTCSRSCGVCTDDEEEGVVRQECSDRAQSCKLWAEGGHCTSSSQRMLSLCPMSCGKCTEKKAAKAEL